MKEKTKLFYLLGVGVAGMFVAGWFAAKEFITVESYRYKNERDWERHCNDIYIHQLAEKEQEIQRLKDELAKKA